MNRVSILLPVAQFRVDFVLATGRPYTKLDYAVLDGVAEGKRTVSDLEETFHVHPRVIIESLVTLTEAGWVVFDEKGLLLSDEGERSLLSGSEPRNRVWRKVHNYLIMERIRGALALNKDASFYTTKRLEDLGILEKALQLAPCVGVGTLDEGQVESLLRSRMGEWISSINKITAVKKENHWIHAWVDMENAEVFNLPDYWREDLSGFILKETEKKWGLVGGRAEEEGKVERRARGLRRAAEERVLGVQSSRDLIELFPSHISSEDLLVTGEEHISRLRRAFTEGGDLVVVMTAFLTPDAIEEAAGWIGEAVDEGSHVAVLWGLSDPEQGVGRASLELLKKLRYDFRAKPGSLFFNDRPTGSHSKLLLWQGVRGFICCIGSYNWLSKRPSAQASDVNVGRNISICIDEEAVVGSVIRSVSGLCAGMGHSPLLRLSARLGRIAEKLAMNTIIRKGSTLREASNSMISVVRDAEHERRFERMWASFERRLAVATHRLNFAASRLHAVERNVRPTDHDIKILYGESAVGEEDTGKIVEDIKDLGASIDRIEGLHCKASVADDEVYIGSFNPLSTDQYGKARNLHELGVYVRSKEVAERVWDVLSELRGGADG